MLFLKPLSPAHLCSLIQIPALLLNTVSKSSIQGSGCSIQRRYIHKDTSRYSPAFAEMTNAVSIPPKIQNPTRTVLVVGASYAGHRVAQQLVTLLPQSWRVVVIERNSHFNRESTRKIQVNLLISQQDLYAFPRVSVVSGHEQKVRCGHPFGKKSDGSL